MLSLSNEALSTIDEGGDASCTLTRLIGDPERAKEKMKKTSSPDEKN